jgi:hypothetical protein
VGAAGGLLAALSCGDKKSQDSVSVSLSPPTSSTPTCAPGARAAPDGGCVADEAADASASASASAAPRSPDVACPDVTRADRIASFDWSTTFRLDAARAARARGTTGVAAETRALAADVEGELRGACARLSRDLGGPGSFGSAEAACLGANEALRSARAKLGATRVNVVIKPAQCFAPAGVFDECVRACDPAATLPAAEALCAKGAVGGKCAATCDGPCALPTPAKCGGQCQGACDGTMMGACEGTCTGRCDGRDMTGAKAGPCQGTCEGKCSGLMRGECRARCEGSCVAKGESCGGTCLGRCAAPLTEVQCGAGFAGTPAEGSCVAFCSTRADRKASCVQARVSVRVDGAKAASAQRFASALERDAPAIVRLSQGMAGRLKAAATKNEAVVADGVKALTGESEGPVSGFGACMGPVFRAVAEGSASLRTNVKAADLVEAGLRAK